MAGKPHNTSRHAWLGLIVLVGYLSLAPLSWLAFNPTSGVCVRGGWGWGLVVLVGYLSLARPSWLAPRSQRVLHA